jgi:hypothetical protein
MMDSCCRKRTKKTIVKARRKKAKTGDIPTPGQATLGQEQQLQEKLQLRPGWR